MAATSVAALPVETSAVQRPRQVVQKSLLEDSKLITMEGGAEKTAGKHSAVPMKNGVPAWPQRKKAVAGVAAEEKRQQGIHFHSRNPRLDFDTGPESRGGGIRKLAQRNSTFNKCMP